MTKKLGRPLGSYGTEPGHVFGIIAIIKNVSAPDYFEDGDGPPGHEVSAVGAVLC